MLPVIGITGRPNLNASSGGDIGGYLVHHTYFDSVSSVGGLPVMLIPVANEHVDDVLDRLDGVLIPGGGDIDQGAEVMANVMNNLESGGEISEEYQGAQGMYDQQQMLQSRMA